MEKRKYKGYTITITPSESNESPNNWDDDERFIVYDHRDFYVKRSGFDPSDIFETYQEKRKLYDKHWFFPVYAYIHSGIALSLGRNEYPFNDRWDVSFKGFAIIKRMKGTWKEDDAYKAAETLIKTWNQYLSGNVYSFLIEDENNEFIDSCGGYYGSPEESGMLEECYNTIEADILLVQTKFIIDVNSLNPVEIY